MAGDAHDLRVDRVGVGMALSQGRVVFPRLYSGLVHSSKNFRRIFDKNGHARVHGRRPFVVVRREYSETSKRLLELLELLANLARPRYCPVKVALPKLKDRSRCDIGHLVVAPEPTPLGGRRVVVDPEVYRPSHEGFET